MRRVTGRGALLATAALATTLLAGCDMTASPGTTTASPSASPSPTPTAVPSPVEGIVVDIDTAGLTDVRAFTIRTDAGDEIAFALDLEDETLFPPAHLAVHLADGYPVVVYSRDESGTLTAYRLEDGTAPSASPSG